MSASRPRSTPKDVRLRAPAKINWTLAVTGRRPDRYHEVDTILQNVSLFDNVRLVRKKSATCSIRCDDRRVPVGRGNLMWRAWDILRRADPERVGGVAIDLQKRIPMGAGLGGGSADAAATMIAVNRLFTLGLHRDELARLAGPLGSDVPFFIRGGVARCRGRGERVEPLLSRLPPIHLVIVFPGFESPTAEAYAQLKPRHFARAENGETAARAIVRGQKGALKKSLANTFHDALTPRDPRYGRLLAAMEETGLNPVMLSGSGSACFGCAESAQEARLVRTALSRIYAQVFAVRTLRSGIRTAGG